MIVQDPYIPTFYELTFPGKDSQLVDLSLRPLGPEGLRFPGNPWRDKNKCSRDYP